MNIYLQHNVPGAPAHTHNDNNGTSNKTHVFSCGLFLQTTKNWFYTFTSFAPKCLLYKDVRIDSSISRYSLTVDKI